MQVISPFHKGLLFLLWLSIVSTETMATESQSFINFTISDSNASEISAIQGGLLIGQIESGSRVWLDDKELRVANDGLFILGFGRDATQAELMVESPNTKRYRQMINIESRVYEIQRINGLPAAKVNPKGEHVLERIRVEALLVKKARARDDDRQDFKAGFIWPAKGRISGVYGSQRILNGQLKRPHYGVDIAAPTGTLVVAPASGIVTLVQSDLYYSGGTLIIDHGFGLSSTFLHLSEIMVKTGQYIEQGKDIAKIGATGRVTGPHLDWRINWFDVRIDAQRLVNHLSMFNH